ncbi:hypothetical protein [Bacillus toyonensis]|uniref:hypothetical protein n=1 Tax=Bacillus toyonensis TaxID=155322 RepID=UPI00269FC01F|nr:hypothetical protein [Bacillus toyonensis]
MNSLQRVTQEIQQGMDNGELRINKIYSECDGKEVKYVIDVLEVDNEETKNAVSVKVEVDTKEANENIKELTTLANECVEAFEKLEKVMERFEKKPEQTFIPTFKPVIDGRALAGAIIRGTQV